jgi:hypothetical protein
MTVLDELDVGDVERALAAHLRGRRITRLVRCPSPTRSSFPLEALDICLDDGTSLALVAKAMDWNAMSSAGVAAKPRFLWNPDRERATYAAVLSRHDLGTAACFGSYVSSAGSRYLLLERIRGVPLWQCGDIEDWREAARWLARLHAGVDTARATASAAEPHLLRYDRDFYERWIERACRFQGNSREMDVLRERHPSVVDALLAEPTAFVHGDFYAANVLVADRGGAQSPAIIRPVDWELAGIGPAALDLACLVAGRWTNEQRCDIGNAYWREHLRLGRSLPPCEQFLRTLDYCLIHLSVRNLGWSPDWSPPPEHAYDWLSEALRLCEKWPC